MRRLPILLFVLLFGAAAWAGSTSSLLPIVVLAPQTITQVSLSNNTVPAGIAAGAVVGSLTATMNPVNPVFLTNGGSFSLSTTQGGCGTTNGAGNANFTISGTSVKTGVSLSPGSYAVCPLASEAGVLPIGGPVTITANPPVTFSPTTIAFGTVSVGTTSAAQSVTITNVSGITLPVAAIAIGGANAGDFAQTNTCPASLAVNGTCTASVTFKPSVASAETASLSFQSVTGGPAFTVALSGTGSSSLLGFVVASTASSPAGNDTNPGTLAAPFATLQRCQTAVRAAVAPNKVCNVRAGTYTGSGNGYAAVTVGGAFNMTTMLHLTSADNGPSPSSPTTYTIYAPDFPSNGISTANFNGGAGAWSPTATAPNCAVNGSPTVGIGWGIYVDGASNITINGLNIHDVCYGGVVVNNGQQVSTIDCVPNVAGGTSDSIVISNNVISNASNMFAQCAGQAQGQMALVEIRGRVTNSTITHNYLFNSQAFGTRADGNRCCGFTTEFQTNLTIDHNFVSNTNTAKCDTGAIYAQDENQNTTGYLVQFNYVYNAGGAGNGFNATTGQCDSTVPNALSAGGGSNAYYSDDGLSNVTYKWNVATGLANRCFFAVHGSAGTNTHQFNICDVQHADAANSGSDVNELGWLWEQSASCNPNGGSACSSGTDSYATNISIGNAGSGCTGNCTVLQNGWPGTVTFGQNAWFNYGSGGTSALTTLANGGGDHGTTIDAFSKCPGGSQNSWGFVIPAGNAVLSSPVSYPAQPAGWATPGFWGPNNGTIGTGFVIPHTLTSSIDGVVHAPSYGPTC